MGKNTSLIKQTIVAFVLFVFVSFISKILDVFNIFLDIPLIEWGFGKIINGIEGIITLIVVIACLLIMTRVKDGRDADIVRGTQIINWTTEKFIGRTVSKKAVNNVFQQMC